MGLAVWDRYDQVCTGMTRIGLVLPGMGQILPGMDRYDQVRDWYEQYGIGMTRYETGYVAKLNLYVTRMRSIR